MRYLITGASGMLGLDLQKAFATDATGPAGPGADSPSRADSPGTPSTSGTAHRAVTALSRADLDITDRDAVDAAVAGHDVVINAAAYTKVDDAETHEAEAYAVNALGAENLAHAASAQGARLVHLSTDYVFDGRADRPYPEDAPLAPVSAYGRTKAEGERRVVAANPGATYIVRTAWLYGAGGPNFARTMLRLAQTHDTVSVVDDQLGQPTWTADLAARLVRLVESDAPAGIYHGTNSGRATWFEFARAVFRLAGLSPDRVVRTDSSAFVRPAPRPAFSVLGHDAWARAGLPPMRGWDAALADAARNGVLDAGPEQG